MQRAGDYSTVLGQELAPVGQKLGVVVLARPVGLESGAQIYLYTVRILLGYTRRRVSGTLCGLGAAKPPEADRRKRAAYAKKPAISL
jgi:hypothetical protein